MRKPAFCLCENKDTDQLCGNRTADQRLCFRYIDSTIPLLPKSGIFKPLAIFDGCTAWFVWGLVGNPEDRFSHNEALLSAQQRLCGESGKMPKLLGRYPDCSEYSQGEKPEFGFVRSF